MRLRNTYNENAPEFKNLTNAEEFNLERSAPPAQKWMALFNKICHITDLENGKSDFNEKHQISSRIPITGQLISVFSGKVLDSYRGFHTESPFSTSTLFLFSSQFSSASISSKAHGCYIGVTTSCNRTVIVLAATQIFFLPWQIYIMSYWLSYHKNFHDVVHISACIEA